MARTMVSPTLAMTLDQVVARLSAKPAVDGILLVGSTGTGELTPASDYDLLVVLSEMPLALRMILTHVDRRLTDVVFFSASAIDRITTADRPVASDDDEDRLLHWLESGSIAYDRRGQLGRAQAKARLAGWAVANHPDDSYSRWFGANYNLAQTRRYAGTQDPVYLMAVDVRLLSELAGLVADYFRVRGLPWRGEKEAVRYWAAHDQPYLQQFRQCVGETDLQRKIEAYERFARLTMAPVGPLWEADATAVLPERDAKWTPEETDSALAFWESLVAEPAPSPSGNRQSLG